MAALNNPQVDYFSLDIEGAEYAVLNSLNWKKVKISALSVEMNHAGEIFDGTRKDIHELLEKNGFTYIKTVHIDDIFIKKGKNI